MDKTTQQCRSVAAGVWSGSRQRRVFHPNLEISSACLPGGWKAHSRAAAAANSFTVASTTAHQREKEGDSMIAHEDTSARDKAYLEVSYLSGSRKIPPPLINGPRFVSKKHILLSEHSAPTVQYDQKLCTTASQMIPCSLNQRKGVPTLIQDFFDDLFQREELPANPYPDLVRRFRIAESAKGEW